MKQRNTIPSVKDLQIRENSSQSLFMFSNVADFSEKTSKVMQSTIVFSNIEEGNFISTKFAVVESTMLCDSKQTATYIDTKNID